MVRFIALIILTGCTLYPSDKKNQLFNQQSFIAHTGSGQYESYLQMNINFAPVKELFNQINQEVTLNKKKARTEAHITVITPVEFRNVLEPVGLDINEINRIALNNNIQKSQFDVICIGKAERESKSTYYLVIKSEDLLKIRREVFKVYIAKGGVPSRWDPELFYPHITIGYTDRDLHLESDGVYKGINSCWRKIQL